MTFSPGSAIYRRRTRVRAPFDDVWDFHATPAGLQALTPGPLNLQIEAVRDPGGEPGPEILETGSTLELSIQPLGIGPRQRWVSLIEMRSERDGAASFRDVMTDGPFLEWRHTHAFFADGGGTIVDDRVEYRLPGGRPGAVVSPLAWPGFEAMFRHRHRRTKSILEGSRSRATPE